MKSGGKWRNSFFSFLCVIFQETSTEMDAKLSILLNKLTTIFHGLSALIDHRNHDVKMFKTLQWNHSTAACGSTWVLNILRSFPAGGFRPSGDPGFATVSMVHKSTDHGKLLKPPCRRPLRFVRHAFIPWGRNECVTNEPQRTSEGRLKLLSRFVNYSLNICPA